MSRDRGEAEGNGMDGSGGGTLVHEVLESFVEVARHAVRASETVDVLLLLSERAVTILPVQACGVLVRDAGGRLRAVGSSSSSAELPDLFQIQEDEGPCVECLRTGSAVSVAATDLQARWPRFTALLATQGIAAVHAFPLRSGPATIGALKLFASGELTDDGRDVAQAFADLAALVLLRDDVAEDAASLAEARTGRPGARHGRAGRRDARGTVHHRSRPGASSPAGGCERTRRHGRPGRHRGRRALVNAPSILGPGLRVRLSGSGRPSAASVYLRRNQSDVLQELPERVDIDEWVSITEADHERYAHLVQGGGGFIPPTPCGLPTSWRFLAFSKARAPGRTRGGRQGRWSESCYLL